MSESNEYNEDLVKSIFPFVKMAIIFMTIGRAILLLISFKKISICKVYIYYQVIYILLELCSNQSLNELLRRRKRLHELEVQCYVN